jgi:hypothetical protein
MTNKPKNDRIKAPTKGSQDARITDSTDATASEKTIVHEMTVRDFLRRHLAGVDYEIYKSVLEEKRGFIVLPGGVPSGEEQKKGSKPSGKNSKESKQTC